MTFEQFQASKREVPDLARALPRQARHWCEQSPGFVYDGGFWIEKITHPGFAELAYFLVIGEHQWITSDLAGLEALLFRATAMVGQYDVH